MLRAFEFFWWEREVSLLPSELREPLGLARATCARTRFGSRAREGRRSNQRRRGRAASESVGAEEARAARTRGNQRTNREVATPLFLFILGIECVCVEASSVKVELLSAPTVALVG